MTKTTRAPMGLALGVMVATGCGGGHAEARSAMDGAAMAPTLAPPMPPEEAPRPSGGGSGASGSRGAVEEGLVVEGEPAPTGGTPGEGAEAAPRRKQRLDIEAWFRLETEQVQATTQSVHRLAEEAGGYVVQESLSSDRYTLPQAELSLRVPAEAIEVFFTRLEQLGTVRGRNVQAKDVGKEYFDAELRLQTLEQTRARYQQLLEQARTVEDIMAVEARLEDVRQRIETLRGELRWLQDRTTLASVHVSLFSAQSVESPYQEPEASFYPGLRLGYAHSWGGDYAASDFVGPGLSVRLSRHFSVDVEGLPTVGSNHTGEEIDLFLATAGGELYSDFLGGGRRRFLNPYLGMRAGYARFLAHDQVAVGAVVGVELYKTPFFTLDLDARGYLLFAYQQQAHALIQPGLSFNVAF